VKNPSAAVLLRLAQAMHVDPDDLFEAAGYPTTRALRQIYQGYEANVDPDLLRYLARFSRDRQRRLLFLLEGMENLVGSSKEEASPQKEALPSGDQFYAEDLPLSSI